MKVDQKVFEEAVNILKNNSLQNVTDSLQSLENHQESMLEEHAASMKRLKFIIVHYKKNQERMEARKQEIQTNHIQLWVPLLKAHQEATIYPEVKKKTVKKIMMAKSEMEDIDTSLEELKLRVFDQAKLTKLLLNDLKVLERKIFILQTAIDIDQYLTGSKIWPGGIAEFEIPRYFDMYRKGRGVSYG